MTCTERVLCTHGSARELAWTPPECGNRADDRPTPVAARGDRLSNPPVRRSLRSSPDARSICQIGDLSIAIRADDGTCRMDKSVRAYKTLLIGSVRGS